VVPKYWCSEFSEWMDGFIIWIVQPTLLKQIFEPHGGGFILPMEPSDLS
jgi:hypothetical protein